MLKRLSGRNGVGPVFTPCSNGCVTARTHGSDMCKEASHEAFIAGYSAGAVCARCAKSWRETWDAAHESPGKPDASASGEPGTLFDTTALRRQVGHYEADAA